MTTFWQRRRAQLIRELAQAGKRGDTARENALLAALERVERGRVREGLKVQVVSPAGNEGSKRCPA